MQSALHRAAPAVAVFGIINFILAGICALWLVSIIAILVYGIGFSGDEGSELAKGILGGAVLTIPGFVGLPVHLLAGLGLLRHRGWGYYCHCAGAVLAAFTCVGLIYTVVAFVFALRPEFSAVFFPSADKNEGMKDDLPSAGSGAEVKRSTTWR